MVEKYLLQTFRCFCLFWPVVVVTDLSLIPPVASSSESSPLSESVIT
jgi:hypothetical protein